MRNAQLLILAVAAVLWASPAAAQEIPDKPRSIDARVAVIVTQLIDQDHMSKHPLDDEISRRAIALFLDSFDEMKLYFTQEDIDEFMQNEEKIDDLLKTRKMQFAFNVYKRYLDRVRERVELVNTLLDGEFDFEKDESVVVDPEAAKFAGSPEETEDFWRRRIKYELLLLKSEKTDLDEAKTRVRKRYRNHERRIRQMSHDDVLERFLTSVASSFDPHTSYFSPSTLEEFRIRMGLNYQGIGAELEPSDSGLAVIRRVMPGGGADKGGELKAKDQIVSVGEGADGEMVDVKDKRLDDVIQLIRGKEGTIVRLGVIPDGAEDVKIYQITRTRIQLDDASAQGSVFPVGVKADGKPFSIGVVDLPSFYLDMEARSKGEENYRSTTRDVRKILEDFKTKQVDAVVLDLRRNGGGSLDEAIALTGLFIDGPVVQVKDTLGRVRQHRDDDSEKGAPGIAWDGPLVVMTSKFSASASEILAGAIQDYERGLIVGDETTHGKGTVQSLVDLGRQLLRINMNLGALKITMQQFYRPSGASTQNEGVKADIVLPSITNVLGKGEKDLDYALAFDRVPAAKFDTHHLVTDDILKELHNASASRLKDSTDFKSVLEEISQFQQQEERTTMPLREKDFLKLRAALNRGDSEEEPEPGEEPEEDEKPDFYMSEVLAIAVDYIRALGPAG